MVRVGQACCQILRRSSGGRRGKREKVVGGRYEAILTSRDGADETLIEVFGEEGLE